MLGYIAYMNLFATTIKKKIMTGFVAFIYKGYENGRLLVDTLFEDGVREPHNDYAASLSPLDMEVPGVWSWEVNLPGMFYTNPRTKETKLYLTILLEHSLFPKSCRNPTNGKSSYRVKNTPPNPDMQDASNWGIMVKLLSMMQGDEGRTVYYEPTKTVNWIDLDSFEPCLTEKDHNYFVGLANFTSNKVTHSPFSLDSFSSFKSVKWNLRHTGIVSKLPIESKLGKSSFETGLDKKEIDEDAIISMHNATSTRSVQKSKTLLARKKPVYDDDDDDELPPPKKPKIVRQESDDDEPQPKKQPKRRNDDEPQSKKLKPRKQESDEEEELPPKKKLKPRKQESDEDEEEELPPKKKSKSEYGSKV